MEALNMAGELKETLEIILAKVSKIDHINESVTRIEHSMSKLEERLSVVAGAILENCITRNRRAEEI